MRTAAIYARVSSEQQREENTIASQTASLIEFAKSHDLEVPKEWVFEDVGYSGATLERPGLERVRDLAAEGQIQVVLAYSPDRLSRKYAYQILLIEEFARHGVETVFVKSPQGDSAEDQLLVQFQGMIAEYERAQILELDRRLAAARTSDPTAKRGQSLQRELTHVGKRIERLLNAYQEGLRHRQQTISVELQAIADQTNDRTAFLRLAETLTAFLARLRSAAETLSDRARITSHLRFDGVVPLRNGFVAVQSQRSDLLWGGF